MTIFCKEHGHVEAYECLATDKRRGPKYRHRRKSCPVCNKQNYNSWAERNRGKILQKSSDWYYANRDRALAYQVATKDRRNMLARERRALRRLGAI